MATASREACGGAVPGPPLSLAFPFSDQADLDGLGDIASELVPPGQCVGACEQFVMLTICEHA